VQAIAFKDYNPNSFRARLGFFSTRPRFIYDTYRKEFHNAVRKACQSKKYDLLIASQVDMATYTEDIRNTKVMIDEIELTIYEEARKKKAGFLRHVRANLTWLKHSRYIASIMRRVDGLSTVSEKEKAILSEIESVCSKLIVIPNGIEMEYYQGDYGAPEADTMIYAGALSYFANLDAVQYFMTEILPIIKKSRPKARLLITGKINDQLIQKLPADPNVEFTGYLDDVRTRIGRAWVSVIPLRIGGGTRLKILESLAMGTPVVSTRKGAEGLQLEADRDLLVKDSAEDFAAGVVAVLESEELRKRLGQAGQKTTGAIYDWKLIGEQFLGFVDEIINGKN
jgi:glycosyltransferase involved in cell wall biosynthesis